jgi:signal transduction histidine kinase
MLKYITALEAIIGFLIGLVALVNNPKSKLHRLYALFSLFGSMWLISNALTLSNSSPGVLLFFGRLITPTSLFATCSLFFFLRELVRSRFFDSRLFVSLLIPNIAVAAFSFTNDNTYLLKDQLQLGKLYPYFVAILVINILGAVILLFATHTNVQYESPRIRAQLTYMRYGFGLSVIPVAIFGAVLPLLGISVLSNINLTFIIIFLVLTGISIVKHKLFDIRLIIARSIAYGATLIVLAVVYGTVVFGIASYIFNRHFSTSTQILFSTATALAALTFQRLKKLFDYGTNRLFYRDFYEPQEVLDKLSNQLIGSVDIEEIQKHSTAVLMKTLKPEFIRFELIAKKEPSEQDLIKRLDQTKATVILFDDLDLHSHTTLRNSLLESKIAMAVKLRTTNEHLGYLVLGYKQSGSVYNDIDKRLLSIACGEIAISLQNALRFKEIQQFNITLQAKVDEATKELKKTNEKLKALDDTKDDFISMASHQLRTPLFIIKGYINMLIGGDAGKISKQQKGFLDQALTSCESMANLVTELLNVSRITSGKFSIETGPVNLADMVDDSVKQLANMAAGKDIVLTFQKPKDFPVLMLDEDKTKQVISNFIDNAIHYSKNKNAKIDVQLSYTDDITFKVIDNGIGVPAHEQEQLFTKFYRANNAKEARPDGTGIGLYLAKVVISEQGGDMIFESQEGIGSTFGFRFKSNKLVDNSKTSKDYI